MTTNNMLNLGASPLAFSSGGTGGLPGVYVSQSIGSDITGDGSIAKPYASFSYAIIQLGSPSVGTTIFCLDSENYDENIAIGVANINISAPTAKLVPTSGDCITLTFNAPVHIEFAAISASGSNRALHIPSFGNLFVKAAELYGKLTNVNGAMGITCDLSYGEMDAGSGIIYGFVGDSLSNPGPFSGNIRLLTPSGPYVGPSSSDFFVPGSLSAGNYTFPAADGLFGQKIVTDGAGALSFETSISLISFDEAVTSGALASGGTQTLVPGGASPFVIRQLWINAGGTSFSGVMGDRNISITDGTTTYATISSAVLIATLVNAEWGDMALPFPVSVAMNTLTVTGQALRAVYSGGTTDYTAGSIVVSGIVEK